MCLTIGPTQKNTVRPRNVYKVYEISREGEISSLYQLTPTDLEPKRFIVSNREKKRITRHEENSASVEHGIHGYINKKDAEKTLRTWWNDDGLHYVVARCLGYPEDFVASGNFNGSASVVYMKVKFMEIVFDTRKEKYEYPSVPF